MSRPSPETVVLRPSAERCPGFITQLILRCAARDEAALGSLFDHLYPAVNTIVSRGTPAGMADALALASFRRLWDHAPSYDPKLQRPVAWVMSEARAVRAAYLQAASAASDEAPRDHGFSVPWITWAAPAIVSPR